MSQARDIGPRPTGVSQFCLRVWDLIAGFNGRGKGPANFVVVGQDEMARKVEKSLAALGYAAHIIVDDDFSRRGMMVGRAEDLEPLQGIDLDGLGEI